MTAEEKRMEKMLFDYKTVTATDYSLFNRGKLNLPPSEKRNLVERPKEHKCRAPLKDLQTLNYLKDGAYLPFTLWIKPNEITRRNPSQIQDVVVKPKDEELEQVIKTRPRVIMTPAISLDTIQEPGERERLIRSTYISTMRKSLEESAAKAFPGDTLKAPLVGKNTSVRPIYLPQLKVGYVCPSWRMASMKWEQQQLRSFIEPTTEFWIRRPISPCMICKETEARQKLRLMRTRNNILASKQ